MLNDCVYRYLLCYYQVQGSGPFHTTIWYLSSFLYWITHLCKHGECHSFVLKTFQPSLFNCHGISKMPFWLCKPNECYSWSVLVSDLALFLSVDLTHNCSRCLRCDWMFFCCDCTLVGIASPLAFTPTLGCFIPGRLR